MAQRYQFVVGSKEAMLRLDQYLVRHLPHIFSRAAIQRAIQDGAVTIGGRVVKAHHRLQPGQTITAHLDHRVTPRPNAVELPQPISLDIVYEDDQALVVNKPPGLVTHPAPGHWSGTLVNAVLWHLKSADRGQKTENPGPPGAQAGAGRLPRAGIVHRLDKDTSGLLVVAKTGLALRELSKQLKARTMSRRYLALVEGHVALDQGTIEASIGRHLTHRKEMTIRYLGGRQAVSHYRVLKRFVQGARGERRGAGEPTPHAPPARLERSPGRARPTPRDLRYTLLEVRLETGRTHQVRVHLAHLGYPVLGDPVYSRNPASVWSARGIHRQLLHAYAIRFMHPTTHQSVELTAGLPDDMMRWVSDIDVATMIMKGGRS